MKCTIQITEEAGPRIIVERRFIPIRIQVAGSGQYFQKEVKLPFTTSKVVGLLTTVRIEKPCIDTPAPNELYYGVTDRLIADSSFTKLSEGFRYEGAYPPDVSIPYGLDGSFWFYAHPVSEGRPFFYGDDIQDYFGEPVIVPVLTQGHCSPDLYAVWSENYVGGMRITYFPEF